MHCLVIAVKVFIECFIATMLEELNSKRYLHKNNIYFPKENCSIVLLLQYGRREHTLLSLKYCLNG